MTYVAMSTAWLQASLEGGSLLGSRWAMTIGTRALHSARIGWHLPC